MNDWKLEWTTCLAPNYGTPDICIADAAGTQVRDVNGRSYTDLLGGVAVNALGHRHPTVEAAVQQQMTHAWHVSNLYAHPEILQLARTLRRMTGRKALFVNSGTEANEAALKLVRRHAHNQGRPNAVIVSFDGSFHGRTTGALSLTGQSAHRADFDTVDGVVHAPWNDASALEDVFRKHDVAGVFFEPIQGEGGVHPMENEFAAKLAQLADKHDAIVVCDEVQTGLGRTGAMWGHEHLPIQPDIITSAKALGGGWPIGVCLIPDALANVMEPGTHGCTFGGHPVAAAAANATLRVMAENDLPARAAELGARVKAMAAEDGVEVRGDGLLLGFPLRSPVANEARQAMQDAGFLVGVAGPDVVRIAPPLTIDDETLASATRTLCGVIHALEMPVPA